MVKGGAGAGIWGLELNASSHSFTYSPFLSPKLSVAAFMADYGTGSPTPA